MIGRRAGSRQHPRSSSPMSSRADDTIRGTGCWRGWANACLRPGGVELTRTLLACAEVADADVLELAPGLGRTVTMRRTFRKHRERLAAVAIVAHKAAASTEMSTSNCGTSARPVGDKRL